MSIRSIHGVLAPAKLNLFLHIVGRRADGYHLVQSAFALIDWCDTLHLERNDSGRLARRDLGEPLPTDDLCLRAAAALQRASGTSFGVDLTIDKQIPTGAGMGGGSSDAAATLLALNRLWSLHWPLPRLLPIALSLGADVPFFCGGQNAWVEGIGERITPLVLPPTRYAVVKPAQGLATAEIFAHPGLTRNSELAILEGCQQGVAGGDDGALRQAWSVGDIVAGAGRNDLQGVAELLCPDVGAASAWLQVRFGQARMTGSGSAVFARLPAGQDAPAGLVGLPAGWIGRVCDGLAQHPLAGWADATIGE